MLEMATGELRDSKDGHLLDHSMRLLGPQPAKKHALLHAAAVWPRAPPRQVLAATTARCRDGTVSAGDVALFSPGEGAGVARGRVLCHVQHGHASKTVLEQFALLAWHDSHALWRADAGVEVAVRSGAGPLQCDICSGSRSNNDLDSLEVAGGKLPNFPLPLSLCRLPPKLSRLALEPVHACCPAFASSPWSLCRLVWSKKKTKLVWRKFPLLSAATCPCPGFNDCENRMLELRELAH